MTASTKVLLFVFALVAICSLASAAPQVSVVAEAGEAKVIAAAPVDDCKHLCMDYYYCMNYYNGHSQCAYKKKNCSCPMAK